MSLREHLVLNSRGACAIALLLAFLQFVGGFWALVRAIRSNTLHQPHDFLGFHGLVLIVFYGILAWGMVMCWIRTHGRERVFFVGWFTYPMLLAIMEYHFPRGHTTMSILGLLGPAAAMLAALSLLLDPALAPHSATAGDVTQER